jgi:hypothetical protein
MTRPRKILFVGAALTICALYALLTAGAVIYTYNGFGGQRDIVLSEGLESDLWVDSSVKRTGAMFIGHYFRTKKLPRALRLQIWDTKIEYSSITVNKITVTYPDGRTVNTKSPWTRKLKYFEHPYGTAEGIVYKPMMMLSDTIPDVIDQYSDCVVQLDGFLVTTEGKSVLFSVKEKFEYESDFGITTYWYVIAGV